MKKWWNYRFRMVWPEGQLAKSCIDILLIDVVARPVLSELRREIPLWRFHRRWGRDKKGHEFTFSCYTEDPTAHTIHERFLSDQTLTRLENANLLGNYYCPEEERGSNRSNIEDISDPSWPIEVQKSWPIFIMGVSDMLLKLIAQAKSTMPPIDLSGPTNKIEAYYINLSNRICAMWRHHGSHAFFHHINALFGYQRLLAHPEIEVRF